MQQQQGTTVPSCSPLRPPTPPAIREAVLADLAAGLPRSEIAAKHGISVGGVWHIADKARPREPVRKRPEPPSPGTPPGFSADTEILTRRHSWVTIDQLAEADEVAVRVDGRFTWLRPPKVTWRPYRGDMLWFNSRTTNLMITPATPLPHLNRQRARGADGKSAGLPAVERTLPAYLFPVSGAALIATSTWAPEAPPAEITLAPKPVRADGRRNTGRPPKSFRVGIGDFAAFMGMWLAEGSANGDRAIGRYEIWVWQNYMGRGYAEYQDLLDRVNGRHLGWVKSGGWHFRNKGLYEYLKACGDYAHDKHVPPEILGLPREHLERFWRYYWLGDGTTMVSPGRKPVEVISTASRVMADNMQEILQKLGGWALIQIVDHGKYPSSLGGAPYLTRRLVRRASPVAYARNPERVPCDGMVGYVETGVGPVYVRRNYRPVWVGA